MDRGEVRKKKRYKDPYKKGGHSRLKKSRLKNNKGGKLPWEDGELPWDN